MAHRCSLVLAALTLFSLASPSRADVIGGVEFPGGLASFADAVVSCAPNISGAGQPTAPYRDCSRAIGAPDVSSPGINYVSLGDGGSIALRFVDNSLTGSGNSDNDLWIFEIGPDVEDTFVWISGNGADWSPVGKVTGSTRGIDIDAFGFGLGQYFSYVKLLDDTNEGDQSGSTVGADIDAVGAISSAPPVSVPEPATLLLMLSGVGASLWSRRRRG